MTTNRLTSALRAAQVPPFHAMAMSSKATARAKSGQRTLFLQVGQPSTGAPVRARQAVIDAMRDGSPLGYTNAPGLPALAERIARHYHDVHGQAVASDRITIVSGASAGFTLAFLAAFDAGDRVAVLEPGYPCYRNTLLALGATPVPIAVGPESRWIPTRAMLDAAGPIDGLVIASPSNPTGTTLDSTSLDEIVSWCRERNVQLIADEIYHGITYDGPAPTLAGRAPDAVIINSFSKYFSMTGWRLGWMVVPDHLRDAVDRLQQNLYICAPHVSQIAGLAAFDCTEELDGHVARYAVNRRVLIAGLAAAGIDRIAAADGAFYVYADVGHLADDSMELCHQWLDRLGVATTPGLDFDLARGHRFVRFSYAGEREHLEEACGLLAGWKP
ncbi:MAG: 1-aminocyclopropane-1-carboxylate deaminase [Acidimicrobiales bacterium mtb01]|nr:aminotransferase class I/II-fold pyridoxal phosphate-dependent enzyme [Actinomycetota bacterium]TEX48434.1 MAG: 1-aminocyclopropane-1-carboxylate deaminase [Acidimicrobiales bacterium mtb01]